MRFDRATRGDEDISTFLFPFDALKCDFSKLSANLHRDWGRIPARDIFDRDVVGPIVATEQFDVGAARNKTA